MPSTYESIATNTLGTATSTITFSSIPSSWTDLRVVLSSKANSTVAVVFRFNSDTATNYSKTTLYYGPAGLRQINQTSIVSWNSLLSGNWQSRMYDIFSYAGSQFKTLLFSENASESASVGGVSRAVGMWRSTAAITSITISTSSSTFAVGTIATLYGIKAA